MRGAPEMLDARRDIALTFLMFSANIFMLISPLLVYRAPRRLFIWWCCLGFLVPVISTLTPQLVHVPIWAIQTRHWLAGYYLWSASILVAYVSVVVSGLTQTRADASQVGVTICSSCITPDSLAQWLNSPPCGRDV
jgi:uncharacterized membrane protein